MNIKVRVIPRAKKSKIETFNEGLKVYLNSPAAEGRANKELIDMLAKHYKARKCNVTIIKGHKQRNKLIQISEVSW